MVNLQDIQRVPRLGDILANIPYVGQFVQGQWTLVDADSLTPICEFDTFIGYQAKLNSSVPSQNTEKGGFTAYNKVNMPDEFSVILAKSGYATQLNQLLSQLELYKKSTKLVSLVLPFRTYTSLNLTNINHGRSEGDSINMLVAELAFKEIREQEAEYTTTGTKTLAAKRVANAGDASTVNRGKQQSKDASWLASAVNWFKQNW